VAVIVFADIEGVAAFAFLSIIGRLRKPSRQELSCSQDAKSDIILQNNVL
jgi:hypothetical protein